ncbi:MAG: ABC transporter permease [Sphaerochaetaceae bacterium]|nr:ABC transporter permease [Sphaerochaetaceae bacterium]MDX9938780.1 ABC transporter permease [Sphaerochaetaceae bacterium]
MRVVVEKRDTRSKRMAILIPLVSFIVSLMLGAIVLIASKSNPLQAYGAMLNGAFGNARRFQYTIVESLPLLMCGLGVGIAFRLKFWNIGAEGQYVWGAIGITWVMQFWRFLPVPMLLPVGLVVGMTLGALWAGVPGFLKAQWSVDETLTTLMLNYVAIGLAEYLYINKWKAPLGNMGTPEFPREAWLPQIWGKVHAGIFIALALVVLLWFLLYKTRWGFELNMIGKNPKAARYQGVSIKRNIVLAMILSGAICGLSGSVNTAAIAHRLTKGVNAGYGFTGIIIAWMSGLNPFASILVAVVMAALTTGADALQIAMKLPESMGEVLQGLVLIPLLAGSIFVEHKLKFIKKEAA